MLKDIIGPSRIICVDTETTGLDPYGTMESRGEYPARIFAVSITTYEGKDAYFRFDVNPYTRKPKYSQKMSELLQLKEVLEDETIEKVFHNSNFDIIMFWHIGIDVKGRVWDTLAMLHVYKNDMREYGLKPVTKKLFDFPEDDLDQLQESTRSARKKAKKLGYRLSDSVNADYWLADPELVEKYALEDTHRTLTLFIPLLEEYKSDKALARVIDMELSLLPVLRRMMLRGHKIDGTVAEELRVYYTEIINAQTARKKDLGYESLNPDSPKQMMRVFYEEIGMPIQYKITKDKHGNRTKRPTINSDALASFADKTPLAECLVILNTAGHQLDSFVNPIAKSSYGGRVHTNYIAHGPITGRLAATKPNLMNITSPTSTKKKTDQVEYYLRKVFVPEEGHLLYFFDYSQIEVWLTAFLSQEPILMHALLNGLDIHAITAEACYGHRPDFATNKKMYRQKGKIINFASIYGAGAGALAAQAECTYEEGLEIHRLFWNKYRTLSAYNNEQQAKARRDGRLVNVFGRTYHFSNESAHKALNTEVQGTAAEIIKRAMINVDRLFASKYEGCHLQITVHDELGSEVPLSLHSKELMQDKVTCMQDRFHELVGMPKPFPVSPSIAHKSWFHKVEIDTNTWEPVKQ